MLHETIVLKFGMFNPKRDGNRKKIILIKVEISMNADIVITIVIIVYIAMLAEYVINQIKNKK